MKKLSVNSQCAPLSINGESLGTGRGLFFGHPTNSRNTPDVAHF